MENIINEMATRSLVNQFIPVNATYKTENRKECGVIGICYVPMQEWEQIYDEDTAFSVGTLFPALNLPFLGGGK